MIFSVLTSKKANLLLLALLVFIVPINDSFAHSRGESYSKWEIAASGEVELIYTIKLKDVNQIGEAFVVSKPGWELRISNYLEEQIRLINKGLACETLKPFQYSLAGSYFQLRKSFLCSGSDDLTIINNGLFDIDQRHMNISRVSFEGNTIREKIFLHQDRTWSLAEGSEFGNSTVYKVIQYLWIGIEHIVFGPDHLAFLAGILLLISARKAGWKALALVITGFTLGHSISLILTVTGYLVPRPLFVESMIALSIALVAVECIALKQEAYRFFAGALLLLLLLYLVASSSVIDSAIPVLSQLGILLFVVCYFLYSGQSKHIANQYVLTTSFGVIHGFGFAGSLLEIGLPTENLIAALASFNIGVELGQLFAIFLALAAVKIIKRIFPDLRSDIWIELVCAMLAALACYWFIQRSIL